MLRSQLVLQLVAITIIFCAKLYLLQFLLLPVQLFFFIHLEMNLLVWGINATLTLAIHTHVNHTQCDLYLSNSIQAKKSYLMCLKA